MLIIKSLYLSDEKNLNIVSRLTDMSVDEIKTIVGIFNKNSSRRGLVRGEYVECVDGRMIIRHHFTKKILWSNY